MDCLLKVGKASLLQVKEFKYLLWVPQSELVHVAEEREVWGSFRELLSLQADPTYHCN